MHFEKGLLVISKTRLVAGAAALALLLKRLLQLSWSTVTELLWLQDINLVFSRSKGVLKQKKGIALIPNSRRLNDQCLGI